MQWLEIGKVVRVLDKKNTGSESYKKKEITKEIKLMDGQTDGVSYKADAK